MVVAVAGVIWLSAIFFFPVVFLLLAFLAILLPAFHWDRRRKGVKLFTVAPKEWRECITEHASETAKQLGILEVPSPGVAGRLPQTFKRLFPDDRYLLVPSTFITSPIDKVSAGLVSDIIEDQLAHGALARHVIWEEMFLLPARAVPFFYAAYRKTRDLSVDRILFLLSKNRKQTDGGADPDSSELSLKVKPPGNRDKQLQSLGSRLKRIGYHLYSLHPSVQRRLSELRRYQTRADRRERIRNAARPDIAKPGRLAGQDISVGAFFRASWGQAKIWSRIVRIRKAYAGKVIAHTQRQQRLAGPVIGLVALCVIVFLISSALDDVVRQRLACWSNKGAKRAGANETGSRENKAPQAIVNPEVLPAVRPNRENDAGNNREKYRPRDDRTAVSRRHTADNHGRKNRNNVLRRPAVEVSLNNALRDGGYKGIRAIVMPDGRIVLQGSTFSNRQKKLAFKTVRDHTNTERIRDLVYVVEE